MSSHPTTREGPLSTCSPNRPGELCDYFSHDSYTAQRLQHASPKHLHITSRRFFIGPLPKGWLNSHRKSWYKTWLGLQNYSSRPATFSAEPSMVHQRQLAISAEQAPPESYRLSFPQPEDIYGDGEQERPPDSSMEPDIRAIDFVNSSETRSPQLGQSSSEPSATLLQDNQQQRSDCTNVTYAGESNPVPRMPSPHQASKTYFPTRESIGGKNRPGSVNLRSPTDKRSQAPQPAEDHGNVPPSAQQSTTSLGGDAGSSASLLSHERPKPKAAISEISSRPQREDPKQSTRNKMGLGHKGSGHQTLTNLVPSTVRFSLEDNVLDRQLRLRSQLSRTHEALSTKKQRRQSLNDGEIIRAERMLVRINATKQTLPHNYSEIESIRTSTRTVQGWREFLVVCRKGAAKDTPFLLQLYKTRVIPKVQLPQLKKSSSEEIPLKSKSTKINLYSSLDKAFVVWYPYKEETRICIMQTRSTEHSVEWYTFIRESLGWRRPSTLSVRVPDLGVTVLLEGPFEHLEASNPPAGQNAEDSSLSQMGTLEQGVASRIIRTCMTTLEWCPDWTDVLSSWSEFEKMGLAWRRYDRLEWVHGPNEQGMYGATAMRASHELELRPKEHYPTRVEHPKGNKMEEPAPIEGFLILRTSQIGERKRWGKMFSRRLYFSTQNQYLCFCKPAKASPPHPPKLPTISGMNVPSSAQIARDTPVTYNIDPFPLRDGQIWWLSSGNKSHIQRRDAEAHKETGRNVQNLTLAEGYIDLRDVSEVRVVPEGGGDVSRDRQDASRNDVATQQLEFNCGFELVMDNGLVVKFRAYNLDTREEWIRRLSDLVQYWKIRTIEDVCTMRRIRQHNLELLDIDEQQESAVGQFAQKWEVSRTVASPELFNLCGISNCRAIKISGQLYQKPRRHATFTRCNVILADGKLLIFQDVLRKYTGQEIPHIYHERLSVLDLRDSYIYSGILTSYDLLYQNQTFDSNLPGHPTSPRIYLADGWTAADEDVASCFAIWHGTRRTFFRREEKQKEGDIKRKWRQVSALGVAGRSTVFKTRGRAERDQWVRCIATEIDRLQQREDVRVVSKHPSKGLV